MVIVTGSVDADLRYTLIHAPAGGFGASQSRSFDRNIPAPPAHRIAGRIGNR